MRTDEELIFNLWAIYDASTGLIYGLIGRSYRARGTEEEKLALLQSLALADYTCAKRYELPTRFQVVNADGSATQGVTLLSTVRDPDAQLFENMFQNIENELPPIPRFEDGHCTDVRQRIPVNPLCVTTVLYEDEAGAVRPIVSDEDVAWVKEQEEMRGRVWQ